MVDIILEFTPIEISSGIVYKPVSKLAQMFCLLNDIDYATKEQLNKLLAEGYTIDINPFKT